MDEQLSDAQVDKLSNALDAYIAAKAEADVAAKVALVHCVTGAAPSAKTLEEFEIALKFYQTSQLAKIVDG